MSNTPVPFVAYEGGIDYEEGLWDKFLRDRLAGLKTDNATQEEWEAAVAKFKKDSSHD